MVDQHQELELITSSAPPEEAAAVVAAIASFMRATASTVQQPLDLRDPWLRAAILEGVSGAEPDDVRDPWINT